MITVVLVIHLLIALAMIGLILLQKTEGNAMGAGFSGGSATMENAMRPRARANPLGRATSILGISFFATSLGLALLTKPDTDQALSIMAEPAIGGPVVPLIGETAPQTQEDVSESASPTVPTIPNE